jgi:hypothetical protein
MKLTIGKKIKIVNGEGRTVPFDSIQELHDWIVFYGLTDAVSNAIPEGLNNFKGTREF